jgi:hypothetical protein
MNDKLETKDKGLRRLLIVPNLLMWAAFLGLLVWFGLQFENIKADNKVFTYLIILGALLFVSLFGAFRNWLWIKQGKM